MAADDPSIPETYAGAGVDVEAGHRAVDLIRRSVASTARPEVVGGLSLAVGRTIKIIDPEVRNPGSEHWERTFYRAGTAVEQQIEAALRSAAQQKLLDDFAPVWVEFLRGTLQVPA